MAISSPALPSTSSFAPTSTSTRLSKTDEKIAGLSVPVFQALILTTTAVLVITAVVLVCVELFPIAIGALALAVTVLVIGLLFGRFDTSKKKKEKDIQANKTEKVEMHKETQSIQKAANTEVAGAQESKKEVESGPRGSEPPAEDREEAVVPASSAPHTIQPHESARRVLSLKQQLALVDFYSLIFTMRLFTLKNCVRIEPIKYLAETALSKKDTVKIFEDLLGTDERVEQAVLLYFTDGSHIYGIYFDRSIKDQTRTVFMASVACSEEPFPKDNKFFRSFYAYLKTHYPASETHKCLSKKTKFEEVLASKVLSYDSIVQRMFISSEVTYTSQPAGAASLPAPA